MITLHSIQLSDEKDLVNAKNADGKTALHLAIEHGNKG